MQIKNSKGKMYMIYENAKECQENWRKCISNEDATLQDALSLMEVTKIKATIIVDKDMNLIGIVTDGDIRRALVRYLPLSTKLKEICNRSPYFSTMDRTEKEYIDILIENNIFVLPILDHKKRLVAIYDLSKDNINHKYKNPVFLMVGGFGTRLYPLTKNCPKPLLKIGGKPLLESILEHFILCGFENFYMSLHFMPEKIIKHFGDGSKWGCKIEYIMENTPLGTGGALGLLPPDIEQLPIIVMNGDILTNIDFQSLLNFHNASQSESTICIRKYDLQIPYGVVKIKDNFVSEITEKPTHQFFVSAGIYVLEPSVLKDLVKNQFLDMPNLIQKRINMGKKVSTFPIHEYWLDIGQKPDFRKAQIDIETIFSKEPWVSV